MPVVSLVFRLNGDRFPDLGIDRPADPDQAVAAEEIRFRVADLEAIGNSLTVVRLAPKRQEST